MWCWSSHCTQPKDRNHQKQPKGEIGTAIWRDISSAQLLRPLPRESEHQVGYIHDGIQIATNKEVSWAAVSQGHHYTGWDWWNHWPSGATSTFPRGWSHTDSRSSPLLPCMTCLTPGMSLSINCYIRCHLLKEPCKRTMSSKDTPIISLEEWRFRDDLPWTEDKAQISPLCPASKVDRVKK